MGEGRAWLPSAIRFPLTFFFNPIASCRPQWALLSDGVTAALQDQSVPTDQSGHDLGHPSPPGNGTPRVQK